MVDFTSVNGVAPFMTRLFETKRDVRALAGMTICCIGPRTADALAAFGLRADVIPEQFQAEGDPRCSGRGRFGAHVLIPRALVARELLPEQLRAQEVTADVVPVYRPFVRRSRRIGLWRNPGR